MANLEQTADEPKQCETSTKKSSVLNTTLHHTDAPPVPCLIPSFAEARKIVPAPYSCLVLHTHRRHVALLPMFLNKKRSGIQQELNAELLKYSSSLKGVPLAYDGIKIIGHHGDIFDDHGCIHLNVEASFVIFKPRKGEKLVGVINKIGVGHVGCLVHGCFNASVVKPAQLTPEQWRASGLALGSSLQFELFQLDADVAGVLLIRGRLEKSRVNELIDSFSSPETGQDETVEENTEPDRDTTEHPCESSGAPKPKKKKKKNKEKDKRAEEEPSNHQADKAVTRDMNGTETEVGSDPNIRPKEKRQKKKKEKRQEPDAELPSPSADLPGSDSSGYNSDKSSKKRKAQEDKLLQKNADILPAKKKKKK